MCILYELYILTVLVYIVKGSCMALALAWSQTRLLLGKTHLRWRSAMHRYFQLPAVQSIDSTCTNQG